MNYRHFDTILPGGFSGTAFAIYIPGRMGSAREGEQE